MISNYFAISFNWDIKFKNINFFFSKQDDDVIKCFEIYIRLERKTSKPSIYKKLLYSYVNVVRDNE